MSRVICRLVAPLVRLSFIASAPPGGALVSFDGARPRWAGGWLDALLRRAGYLKGGEKAVDPAGLGTAGRVRLAKPAAPRVEFNGGSFSVFRAKARREAEDWDALAGRSGGAA